MGTVLSAIALLLLPLSIFARGSSCADSIPESGKNKQHLSTAHDDLKARFSHRTSKGAIYILPIDNMPCLVPYHIPEMPGKYDYKMPYMPNPSPRFRLRPEKDKEE